MIMVNTQEAKTNKYFAIINAIAFEYKINTCF